MSEPFLVERNFEGQRKAICSAFLRESQTHFSLAQITSVLSNELYVKVQQTRQTHKFSMVKAHQLEVLKRLVDRNVDSRCQLT